MPEPGRGRRACGRLARARYAEATMRPALFALVPIASILLGCASSSHAAATSTLDAATGDAADVAASPLGDAASDTALPPGGGAPECQNACCGTPAPAAGAACATADEGLVCPTTSTCAGGLILPWSLTCAGGAWNATGGVCDVGGGVADDGCPSAQPAKGAACTLPDGTWCQYALVCAPAGCDAGASADATIEDGSASSGSGCAPVAGKVGPAFCRSGAWDTTPLGACP